MKHKTFIINLQDRTERRKHIINEFKDHPEFEISLFNAIRQKPGSQGLFLSIQSIIKKATEDKYIIICEDDHVFTKDYKKEFLNGFIQTGINQNFDLLLGGPSNIHDAFFSDEHLVWLSGFSGFQFAVIFQPFYEVILNYDLPIGADFDLESGKLSNNIYCCYPPISEQAFFGYSDITFRNNNINVTTYFEKCRRKLDNLSKVTQYFNAITK